MTRWGFPSDRSDYKNTTNDKIDKLYDYGVKSGAIGGKILGAGGGGFLLFFVDQKS